jgi:transcriptional regulator with XRE-family HTH domain
MASDEQEKARKELGGKLRQAREAAKMTQQEVATAAGVHVNFYARVERGEENPSFDKLRSIMKVLDIETLSI